MRHRLSVLILLGCLVFSNSLFARREPKPNAVTTQLTKNIHKIFAHDFVNMVVFSGPEGTLLVDTAMDPVNLIQAELEKIGAGPVRYIINTHSNGDHFVGNTVLGKDAIIISSALCREDILKRDDYAVAGLPNLTFQDSMRIHFNGETIDLFFLPGHTGNDIVIHFQNEKIVCVGDLVFWGSFPGTQPVRGGNARVVVETLNRIAMKFPSDVTIVSGHGDEYNMDEMKTYADMASKTLALVTPLVEQGLTLEEIKAKNPLKDWTKWNSTFFPGEITTDTWIENIFDSFKKSE